jgi:hypothetical protein
MSRAAESVRRYCRFFHKRNALKVLDYGTGTMRNALFLSDRGFRVFAADLPEQVEKLRTCPAIRHVERLLATDELSESRLSVDLVLSTYVFNIIMNRAERSSYLATAVANLRPGGYLLMEVRCRRPGVDCGAACADCLACSECAKTLTHEELDTLLTPYGLRRISHYYRSHAVVAIYRMNRASSQCPETG